MRASLVTELYDHCMCVFDACDDPHTSEKEAFFCSISLTAVRTRYICIYLVLQEQRSRVTTYAYVSRSFCNDDTCRTYATYAHVSVIFVDNTGWPMGGAYCNRAILLNTCLILLSNQLLHAVGKVSAVSMYRTISGCCSNSGARCLVPFVVTRVDRLVFRMLVL